MWTIFIFIPTFFCVSKVLGTPEITPEITGALTDIAVKIGEEAQFICTVTDKADSKIQWWFVSGKLSIAIATELGNGVSKLKYVVEETTNSNGITQSRLTVRSASDDDAGLYRCVVRIPRVAYPAWPKEDGVLSISEMKTTPTTFGDTTVTISNVADIRTSEGDTTVTISNVADIRTSQLSVQTETDKLNNRNNSSVLLNNLFIIMSSVIFALVV